MLRLSLLLLLLGALTQTQALKFFARTQPVAEDEQQQRAAQGRVFTIVRESDRDKGYGYDQKPVIITVPGAQPPYPQPYPPFYPPPQQQPIPIPVPIYAPPAYKPHRPYYHQHHHHGDHHYDHHHGSHGSGFGHGGRYPLPFAINITYSPVLTASLAEKTTLTDEKPDIRTMPPAVQAPLNDLIAQLTALQVPQPQDNNALLLNEILRRRAAMPMQQMPQYFVPLAEAADIDTEPQYVVRRTKKPKKKSKKNKQPKPEIIYLPIDSAELNADDDMALINAQDQKELMNDE